jgi:uncharacterized membrane protein YbhN (UPF0104 family)
MLRWIVRAAVSAAVATILLVLIPFDAVRSALSRVSPWVWVASVGIFFAGHYLNALKLRLLLGEAQPGLTSACVRAQYAGLVANLGLPGLAGGDVVRAAYLSPLTGVKRIAMASVADRMIDTLTVLLLVAVALPFAGLPPAVAGVLGKAGLWLGAGLIAAFAAGVILLRAPRFHAVAANVRQVSSQIAARSSAVAGAAVISLVVQSAFVMTNVWLARQVGVTTGVAAWFVAWPLSKLVAVLPISLGGIGVREAALVSLLAPYGAPQDAALASGILWQAVLIVTGVIGLAVTQLLPRAGHTYNKPASAGTNT